MLFQRVLPKDFAQGLQEFSASWSFFQNKVALALPRGLQQVPLENRKGPNVGLELDKDWSLSARTQDGSGHPDFIPRHLLSEMKALPMSLAIDSAR